MSPTPAEPLTAFVLDMPWLAVEKDGESLLLAKSPDSGKLYRIAEVADYSLASYLAALHNEKRDYLRTRAADTTEDPDYPTPPPEFDSRVSFTTTPELAARGFGKSRTPIHYVRSVHEPTVHIARREWPLSRTYCNTHHFGPKLVDVKTVSLPPAPSDVCTDCAAHYFDETRDT